MKRVNMRQQHVMFCHKYIELNFNGEQAAVASGYSPRSARQIASRLLTRDDVKAYLAQLLEELTMDADEVLRLFASMGRGEIPTNVIVNADGERIEHYSAKSALDSIAKALAMFTEKHVITQIDNLEIIDDD